ncbi:MAG: recombinase family protein [Pseudomonadota bacterium]
MTPVRCAIYTRKSSEEGLDQAFNSLDAQHEACAAYIASQRHEGWRHIKARYDDGGVSGGTLERPGLKQLLADIAAGHIDMVVVYKIDRLTRSLTDFAKLIDRLDQAGASFVSVTQQFNTSTSMGRLTLNVLLSFAQFEREVTAERIRDKIAASKKKGMWMGGPLPLGYDKGPGGLVINESEAASVRVLYEAYLELGCVRRVKTFADERGIRTKRQTFKSGRQIGGGSFSRGALYHLLGNPIYAGRIRHKNETYAGLHDAIIDADLWQQVQDRLAKNRAVRSSRVNAAHASPFAGKIFDGAGEPLVPSHANKAGRRYRYYVSKHLVTGDPAKTDGWRLPAQEVEQAVEQFISSAEETGELIAENSPNTRVIFDRIERVEVNNDKIGIKLFGSHERYEFPFSIRKRGVEQKLCFGAQTREPDLVLVRRIQRALNWVDKIRSGTRISEVAAEENISPEFLSNNLKFAFLSPDILDAISSGQQPVDLTAKHLFRVSVPLSWDSQNAMCL